MPTAELERQRLATLILNLTRGTRLAPTPNEQMLLQRYVAGELTLDEVLALLAPPEFVDSEF